MAAHEATAGFNRENLEQIQAVTKLEIICQEKKWE